MLSITAQSKSQAYTTTPHSNSLTPQMLFFGSHCERLCMLQFSLVSLIPGLIRNLHDCADPVFNAYEESLVMPTSLRTSERASLLTYMGLPLQIFGKGSLFGPYTPLQQLDLLADYGTKSYVVGSTNSLLLQQRDRYCDILINVSGLPSDSWRAVSLSVFTQFHFPSMANETLINSLARHSLTKTPSTSPPPPSAPPSSSQPPTAAGSTSSPQP